MPWNNESMSGGGNAPSGDRVQPGRIMLALRESLVDDDLVYRMTSECGEVKSLHRPSNNPQLVFVQYEDPSCAEGAIARLRTCPIFRAVDQALKSERYVAEKSGGGDNQQQKNMKQQQNRGGPNQQQQQQRQQQRGNVNNNQNNMNGNDFRHGRNDDMNNMSYSSMDSGSPPMAQTDSYQPKFSLGCWFCTKLPNFECRCGAFYCNIDCQRADWPKHKDICLPRLVPISYSNQRMLQEAAASKQSSTHNSQFSADQQSQMQQQNQNYRRQGQGNNNNVRVNNPGNQGQQNQQRNQNKDYPRQQQQQNQQHQHQKQQQQQQQQQHQQQQPKTNQPTNNTSPDLNSSTEEKVSRVNSKLQRLKIAKSSVVGTGMKGILMPGVFPREGSLVKITASLPSGVLYIFHNNSKEGGQHSDYYLLTTRMFQAASEAKPLTKVPPVDDVIFAPFMDGFFRAKVTAVDGDKLEVFFVDFGNSDTVEWQKSKEIADEDLKWARYLTFPVRVEGVETFSVEMLKLLETLEHAQDFELVKAEPFQGAIEVVLKRPKQSLTLNMELMEVKERELRQRKEHEEKEKERERLDKERAKKQEQEKKEQAVKKEVKVAEVKVADPSKYQPVLFDESITSEQLSLGGPKRLLIIDASEVLETRIISVVAWEDVEKYAAVLDHCNRVGAKDSNAYKPTEEGEVCLVMYQDDWSRALYDISDNNFMLLDVGIITSVPAANVRRFPPGLSHVVYNNEVVVENLPKLKQMMTDGKPDSVHGVPIHAKIGACQDGLSITIVDSES